jgi:CBS domain-containing protein
MMKTELSLPELGTIVGTRGMLGMGLGLLLANRLGDERRKGAGWTLAAIGVLSTIPLAWMVFNRRTGRAAAAQRVRDVMSRDVEVISPDATVAEAARRMRDGDFGMMPVGENDRMVGAISDRDIAVRGVAQGRDSSAPVRDVMSGGIAWVYDDESVQKAAEIMSTKQVRRLPVVNRAKRLVGIVALGDIAVERRELQPAGEALSAISEPA